MLFAVTTIRLMADFSSEMMEVESQLGDVCKENNSQSRIL